jgi:hypothetical protein
MQPSDERSGIYAKRIEATNVVEGAQLQGAVEQPEQLVALARDLRRGRIEAEDIKATSVVTGLQFISDPSRVTVDELRQEVARLRADIDELVHGGYVADGGDAADLAAAASAAEEELNSGSPSGNRVVRKLAEVSDILSRGAEMAESVERVGGRLAKLAPVAAVLWQLAQRLLGG